MSSELSLALGKGRWQLIVDNVKRDRKKAAVWAAKPGDLTPARHQHDLLHKIEPNIHGLPIHEAINIGAPLKVIDSLARAYPEGLTRKELVMKRLPLHLATIGRQTNRNNNNNNMSTSKLDEQVIVRLIKYYSTALVDGDKLWRTPLHYALLNGASNAIIQYMLQTRPEVAKAQDKRGYTPLHLACQNGYSTTVIRTLLELNPNAVMLVTTLEGITARSFALCRNAPNKEQVLMLLNKYRVRADKQFRTPRRVRSPRVLC